jgi:hypothetical protein
MPGFAIIDIDEVPEEEQAALAVSMRALLRLAELDVGEGDHILCLNAGELSLVTPDNIPVARFANGITPVEIVSALPGSGNFAGRLVFLTTDKKLYRHTGTVWTAAIDASDLSGQLTDAQIASIAAAKIVGQVVASQIADAAINTAKLAAGLRPVEVVSTLPSTGNTAGRMAYLTTDNKLYRYNGSAWVASIAAGDVTGTLTDAQIAAISAAKITGQVVAAQIADAQIGAAKFAAGIRPVEVVSTLPTTGNTAGRMVYLTTDSKLYRYDGTAYVAGVASADIVGTIADAQIAAVAAAKVTGTLTDAQIAAVAAAKLTGTIVTTQIADSAISTPKLAAGAVTAATIAAGAIIAGKIAAGVITAAEIAAGTITGAKIAAGTILAGNIAAGTITGDRIAADAITAGLIAAGAIGASEIAAGAIVAGKIASGVITAAEIAAATITGAKIAAGTITAANLLAGTITANEIAAATITGGKIAAGTIQGANIAADTITAGLIAAGAIGASEIAAGAIVAGKIASGVITATEIAAATITGAKIGAGTITAANLLAGTITANEIAAATITGGKIAAGTIQGANIAADTITAGLIAAGAIGATQIAANAITADKLIISMRDIDSSGIEFSTAGNVLSWTAGTIEYTNDANANASAAISAGSVTWLSGKVYVYWAKGATTLSTATTYAGAKGAGNVIAAIYEGGDNLNTKRGRTIVAGSKIRTGSIDASKLNVANLAAVSAVLGNVDISSANIGTLTVGTINIASGAVTDAKVDQTAPGAPGAPTLTPVTTDVDLDGSLDAALTAAWTAPVSGRTPRKYRVEIWRRKGDKGTDGNNVTGYTFWKNEFTNQISHTFEGNAQYFHKCRIFPISSNDIEGIGSAYTTVGAAPPGRTAGITATGALHWSPGALDILFSWDAVQDPDYWYSEIASSTFSVFDAAKTRIAVAIGTPFRYPTDESGYFYWVRHINRSDVPSAWIGLSVNGNGVPAAPDLITSASIDDAAVLKRHLGSNVLPVGNTGSSSGAVSSNPRASCGADVDAIAVLLFGELKNNEATTVTTTVTIETAGGNIVSSRTMDIRAAESITVHGLATGADIAANYVLRITGGTSTTFHRLTAVSLF